MAYMSNISTTEIQQNPIDFLRRVEAGESLVIVSGSKPVAEIRPINAPIVGTRPYGLCAGDFVVPVDFDSPLPEEILRSFGH